jgi:hypothetical protein
MIPFPPKGEGVGFCAIVAQSGQFPDHPGLEKVTQFQGRGRVGEPVLERSHNPAIKEIELRPRFVALAPVLGPKEVLRKGVLEDLIIFLHGAGGNRGVSSDV